MPMQEDQVNEVTSAAARHLGALCGWGRTLWGTLFSPVHSRWIILLPLNPEMTESSPCRWPLQTHSLRGDGCGIADYKKNLDGPAKGFHGDTVWCYRFQSQIIAKTLLCTLTVKVMERFQVRFY